MIRVTLHLKGVWFTFGASWWGCVRRQSAASGRMKQSASWAPAPNLKVLAVGRDQTDWIVSVDGRDHATCPVWLHDAHQSGVYAMRRFVRTLRQDIDVVQNAVLEPWSNGQTEGKINRLKTLKRAVYGRAGIELLRARMIPLREHDLHRE